MALGDAGMDVLQVLLAAGVGIGIYLVLTDNLGMSRMGGFIIAGIVVGASVVYFD